ncbi:unnamed protein product [Paramecium sonneborni]|uniref:Structural maintenance of chromosomes protein n=1 Tax=Paramecium sonneborni TaxID=65129 RepID=A0A8S1KT08_9CILI|nr:unnamed protein product [Paramecium sonneborni]
MIKEVILENFKSYYGEHRIICGSHFNSIIGPNGSGKSNFIDAIQFVFGKRATSMRCKTVSQLISAGMSECRVEVIFDGFSLKRTIKGNTTEVYIDNEPVKQNKLHQYLKSKNIDATNKFIILQGEVESISMMKPKSGNFEQPGLLEYIEEEYQKEQMEESFRKKQIAQSRYFESQEKANIAQHTLNEIKGMVDLSEFVKSVYSRIFRVQLCQIEILKKEQVLIQLEDEIMNENAEILLQTECRQRQMDDLKILRGEKERIDQEIKDTENQQKIINLEINSIVNKYDQNEELECQLNINKLQKQIDDLIKEKELLEQDQRKFEQMIPEKQNKVDKIEKEKNIAETHYNKLKTDLKVESRFLMKQKEELEQKLKPFNKQIHDLQIQLEKLQLEKERTSKSPDEFLNQLDQFDKKTFQLQVQIEQINSYIERQLDLQSLIRDSKEKTIKELSDKKSDEKRLTNEIAQKQERLDQNNEDRQEKNQYSIVLRALIRASQAGQLKICGRLGDLGTIDPKYECAITTACPGLDGIVVENDQDAVDCINFLKQNQIGRALFIPINKVPENVIQFMERPFRPQDKTLRLFDLINFKDNKYRSVFYNLLRDTLVVDNIEIARDIGIGQRKRVVTLDGKLVEQSGVMSGGPEQRKGGMSSKFYEELSNDQREQLIRDRNILKEKLDSTKFEILALEKKLKETLSDEEMVNSKHKQRLVDKNMLQEQINDNKKQMEILQIQYQECHYNQQKNQEVRKEIELLQREIEKIQNKTCLDQQDLQAIDDKLKEIANQDLNSAKDMFSNYTQTYETYQQELLKVITQKTITGKKIVQNTQNIQLETENFEKLKDQLKRIQDKKYQDSNVVEAHKQQLHRLQSSLNVIKAQQAILSKQIDDLVKTITSINTVIEETEDKKQAYILKKNIEKQDQEKNRSKQKELIEEHKEYFLAFNSDSGNPNLFFQINQENIFCQQLLTEIQKVRNEYYQKFREFFIPAGIEEFLPESIPKDIQLIKDANKLFTKQQNLIDIYTELGTSDNKNKDKNLMKIFMDRSLDYEIKLRRAKDDEINFQQEKSRNEDLFQDRKIQFAKTLKNVELKLQEIYKHLSMGGEAEIKVIDELEIFKEGLQFMVKPPNKTWKQISKLSGGEKTLASLSLMLAIHFYRPTPIYILDEIDAALDFKNVKIVAEFLDKIDSQFIIVSLRTNMFEKASNLIGLYMRDTNHSTEVIQLEV